MERFRQRENVLLGYSPQRSFERPFSSPDTSCRNSDIDFNDVFGGPPRRSSIQDTRTRYSFSEQVDPNTSLGKEDKVSFPGWWSCLGEKPVFGQEFVNRKRHPSHDFFDDIFGGDESHGSPRRTDRDPFSSTPGSRVISPAHPLPPKAEPFGTSLPSPFSLPARLTNPMDFPALPSGICSLHKSRDGISNGNHSHPQNASHSRFSGLAIQGQNELRRDAQPSYGQSPLSQEFYGSSEEPSYLTKSDGTDTGVNLKEESKRAETPNRNSQFHFSIYKWAGRGVPLLMPLRGGNGSKLKERGESKTEKCSSSNGRIENGRIVGELRRLNLPDIDSLSLNDSVSANTESSKIQGERTEDIDSKGRIEVGQVVEEEAVLDSPESKPLNGGQCAAVNESATVFTNKKEEPKHHPTIDGDLSGNKDQEISGVTKEARSRKPERRPLSSLLNDELEGEGNDESARKAEKKEIFAEWSNLDHANVDFSKSLKDEGKRTKSGNNFERSGVTGKVKEFVKIFNNEAGSKPQLNFHTRSYSSRWKGLSTRGANNDARISSRESDKRMPNVNKISDASFMVDENLERLGKQHCHIKMAPHKACDNSSAQKDGPSFSKSFPGELNVTHGNMDDPFQGSFLIKELPHDEGKFLHSGEDSDDIQVLDAKIRQWSNGKKGNIRSLLSTLQYVLWPDSGWKPVPLVDIIEASAVKQAYQKALLCLHPDKLQQKGSDTFTSQQFKLWGLGDHSCIRNDAASLFSLILDQGLTLRI